jgi:small subunit ribosomal protein S5
MRLAQTGANVSQAPSSNKSRGGGGDSGSGSGRGRGDQGRGRGGDQGRGREQRSDQIEKVVQIRRCAAVVKGGRRFSFSAIVVVGNGKGKVGWGYGKANEVPPSVEKATKDGGRKMIDVEIVGSGTIPHTIEGRFGAAHVILVPASAGTGVIAGASVRAVCEAAGIHNILTKSFGSTNPANLVKATIGALASLRTRQDIERLRGVSLV